MCNGGEERTLSECAYTVDELEAILSMDFFYNLPDKLERRVERVVTWDDWGL